MVKLIVAGRAAAFMLMTWATCVHADETAVAQARAASRRDGKLHNPRVVLAALLASQNSPEEATSALAEARRIRPQLSLREARGIVGGRYAEALRGIWDR